MSKHLDNNEPEQNQTGDQFPVDDAAPIYGAEFDSARLRAEVYEAMARLGVKQAKVAGNIGIARSSFNEWLKDQYKANPQAVEQKVREWLGSLPKVTGGSFVETPTAERILSTLAYSQAHGDMCHIYGGPGVGKTSSLRHFVATYPEKAWLATITPSSSALVSSLQTVARALGLGNVTGGALAVSTAIRKSLAEFSETILIIDEAQHLTMSAIEELRSIHDEVECGLALVGNETSYARLTGPARAASFAQIYSRLGAVINLQRPTDGDVDTLCDSWQVQDESARQLLRKISQRPGALRSVNKVLRLLARSGVRVNRQRVVEACRMLGAEV